MKTEPQSFDLFRQSADEPTPDPSQEEPGAPKYPEVCQRAMKRDLIINTVQCGALPETTPIWREIASLSEGSYIAIAQSGGMIAIATPMDSELAELNRKLGATMVPYGDESARRKHRCHVSRFMENLTRQNIQHPTSNV